MRGRRSPRSDFWAVVGGVLLLVIVLAMVAGGIYLRYFAPCDAAAHFLPIKEMPSRCFTFIRH